MAIIKYSKDTTGRANFLNIFPDQFLSETQKKDPDWIKDTMDYFSTRAYAAYARNKSSFSKNYELMKGILTRADFYEEPEVKSFVEILEADVDLPAYVKHYSIITTPINELVGEMSKRPDTYKVKAFDDDSRSEELSYRTEILQNLVLSKVREKVIASAKQQGIELSDEEEEQLTLEKAKEDIDDYTSVAEKWGNKVLTALKAEFNMKELSEEAYRDLLVSTREFFHIYEDNSKLGFDIVVENPKNVWYLIGPDKKYVSDPSGRARGAFAGGTIHVMELSEIIEAFPDLTKEEIDHLRKVAQDDGLVDVRESNYGRDVTPGIESITYDTYDPLVVQTRAIIESELREHSDGIEDFLNLPSSASSFGYRYVVVRAYWLSKKKIGRVQYIDEMGNVESLLVDEYYKSGTIPTQISLEWGWANQWMQGAKIGPTVYHVKPYKLLSYFPIIGMVHEIKNTEARSMVDLMKPYQVLYNICLNQLYRLLEKEIGNVASINVRRIPKLKDGDDQDALDVWEAEARERGVVFDDDSPENTKAPVSNQSVAKNIDLTRTNEIQSRYNLAVQLKNECWELVGMSKQRLGQISATETATGTNTAIQQSYSQTEPLFVAHEYIMGQLYQAILDAAQYIESHKETSTVSYITSEGESSFIQVNGDDLKLRDLKVFPTNRPEDTQMFNEIRLLAQAVLQNGGSIYDIVEMYSTKSLREMKRSFKELRDKQLQMQEEAQKLEQAKLQQNEEIAKAQLEEQKYEAEQKRIDENYNKEMDRLNKKEIAIIQATGFGKVGSEDIDQDNIPDAFEVSKLAQERNKTNSERDIKLKELASKREVDLEKLKVEKEKLQVERENQKNDLAIARENAKGRAKKSSSKK